MKIIPPKTKLMKNKWKRKISTFSMILVYLITRSLLIMLKYNATEGSNN